MFKKFLSFILVLLVAFSLVACKKKPNKEEDKKPTIEQPEEPETPDVPEEPETPDVPEEPEIPNETKIPTYEVDTFVSTEFINKSKEYEIANNNVELLFLANSVIPFVNIEDYLMLLDGAYISEEFEFIKVNEILEINLYVTYGDEEYVETLTINSSLNLVHATSLDFFSLYLEQPETNYSEGLLYLPTEGIEGESVTFELGEYDFDVLKHNQEFYLPLVIANLLFNQDNYFDTYYNGETLYGVDTSALEDKDIKEILKSSYNDYKMNEELAVYDYNFYTLVIDYFYGLKSDRNILSAKNFIDKKDFVSENNTYKNIFDVTVKLDDLHTSHMTRGYFNNKKLSLSYATFNNGPIVNKFYTGLRTVQNQAASYFGTKDGYIDFKDYEYIDNGKTLVIYILGFDVNTPVEVEEVIKNIKPETENIVIDLSFNTGGNLGAVLRMFALMTNEVINYHTINPLNGEKVTYRTKGDRPAYDQYKYAIKISSVTFSAANLAANIAKELEIKVIGRDSSGGASSISFFVFPTGSIIIMSSNMVLSNQNYESIEKGITVDHYLQNLYDEQSIIEAIQ